MSYKICYVTTLPGTIEAFVVKHAVYCVEHGGWDVTVICADEKGFRDRLPNSIHFIPLDIKRGISLSGIKSTLELFRIFRKEQFNLVQYATANAGAYASIAARWAKVPVRIYNQWGIGYVYMKGIKHFLKKNLEKMICSNSTHIQPDSKENLNIALSEGLYNETKGCVIGYGSACGVDLKKFDISKKDQWRKEIRKKYSISENSFVIGYVGRLLKDKGINELLEAYKDIHKLHPETYLMIVGNNTMSEGVSQEKLKWAHSEKSIIFTGPSREVEKYYAAMDCFTLPSYHEGFGMVTIEAEAMGVPIVDTDIPGSREAMQNGKTGILIPRQDSRALFEGIIHLYNNSNLRSTYSRNGVKYVRQYFDELLVCKLTYENRNAILKKFTKEGHHN